MILYHLTRPELLDSIMREGLLASRTTDIVLPGEYIWLTARPSLAALPGDRTRLLLMGETDASIDDNMSDRTVCLRVDLSPNSKRLRHFPAWLLAERTNNPGYSDIADTWASLEAAQDWWLYFGDIAPELLAVLPK